MVVNFCNPSYLYRGKKLGEWGLRPVPRQKHDTLSEKQTNKQKTKTTNKKRLEVRLK
jgi:hypothetical protein